MDQITGAEISSTLDFDYGEGWTTISWHDEHRVNRALRIDFDGHCSREMPIRSGSGVTILAVLPDRVQLRFTRELALSLELESEIEFVARMLPAVRNDLLRLAELL